MRGGKYEEKLTSPMFPRLHVNDTEKGGPRAPPRNKMALYEQLSIPSQRVTSGSASILPIWPSNNSSLAPSTSSTHVGVHQTSMLTRFCKSPKPSHLAEKPHPSSFSGDKLDTVMVSHEQNSPKPTCFQTLNATGLSSSTSKCESFHPYNFSCFKKLSPKKLGVKDDRVVASGPGITSHCGNDQYCRDQERFPPLSLSSSVKLQNACERQTNGNGTIDLKWMGFKRKHAGDNTKVSKGNVAPMERSASITSSKDKDLVDTSSIPLTRVKNSESLKRTREVSNRGDRSSLVHHLNRLKDTNYQFHKASVAVQDRTAPKEDIVKSGMRSKATENASKLRSKSCSSPCLGDECRRTSGLVNNSDCCEDRRCRSTKLVGFHDNASDTYMVESISNLNVSPDDVVGVIGEKLFWKARRAIINQQRVFAVQVFELHRLIKVQKLIAASPDLLLEGNLYFGNRSIKVSPVKNLPSAHVPEPPASLIAGDNNNSLKSNPNIEYADENAVRKFPLPSVKNDSSKGLVTPQSNNGFHSANPSLAPMTSNTKPAPFCFHPPPGNQWLVPAMSPSEGLVYKPFTGSCLPTAGFMAPAYGNCGRVSPGSVDLLNTVYGVPVSHPGFGVLPGSPPLGQSYFPLYGMPLVNQSLSSSAVEQISPLAAAQSNEQDNQALARGINCTIPYQTSCNMSGNITRVISGQAGKLPTSKECEFQGSTASSPSERAIGDALPLFPTMPTVQAASDNIVQNSVQRAEVIKVVPRNPRSASESAFRIFRSIQEERKQI